MHDDPFARAVERVEAAERAEEETKRRRRQDRLTEGSRTAFRVHLTVYLAVNLLLVAIWLTAWQLNDATSYPWFIWPLLGWGIGLAAHYAAARNHLSRGSVDRPEPAGRDEPAASPAPGVAAELARLSELHEAGSLSDEEFSAAKAKLLE